ncbi:MAG: leucyl aminopeptidase [Chloroflexota bacterium]
MTSPGEVEQNLTLQTMTTREWPGGLQAVFAPAPETVLPETPGKETGEVRFNPARNEAIVSLGGEQKLSTETYRRAGGALARWLAKNNVASAGVAVDSLPVFRVPYEAALNALCEGLLLGAFQFSAYKSGEDKAANVTVSLLSESNISLVRRIAGRATLVCQAVNQTRAWAHEPPNVINLVTLAERVRDLAAGTNLKVTVLDDRQLEQLGAGALVAVGKGSNAPSRLILIEYPGKGSAKRSAPIALVGKAITFDTGGYTIKNSEGIVGMKYDKSGAMAVIGVLSAASRLGLRTPLVGVIAAAENMISGGAYHPDDILKSLSGKTIEIVSTDAEGRLVLADALTYAQQAYNPRLVIDVATLTGGVVVALGSVRAGLLSNNTALAECLFDAGERTHERLWRLPLDDDYFEQIKGDDADIKNSGGRKAQPVIGGMFLKQFIGEDVPWAHLDIPGVATLEKESPTCPKGATGFGVRLLIDYLETLEQEAEE